MLDRRSISICRCAYVMLLIVQEHLRTYLCTTRKLYSKTNPRTASNRYVIHRTACKLHVAEPIDTSSQQPCPGSKPGPCDHLTMRFFFIPWKTNFNVILNSPNTPCAVFLARHVSCCKTRVTNQLHTIQATDSSTDLQ
jgi:hypothetical protein